MPLGLVRKHTCIRFSSDLPVSDHLDTEAHAFNTYVQKKKKKIVKDF